MKSFIIVTIISAVLGMLIGITYLWRNVSNVTTPMMVREAEPGIRCATLVTSDGAAIDCWEVKVK